MKIKNAFRFISLLLIFYCIPQSFLLNAGESLNQVMAIIGNRSISKIDYDEAEERYKKMSKIFPPSPAELKLSMKSRVLNNLIVRAIVDITADEETIQVNEARIQSEIQKRMEIMGLQTQEEFEKAIKAQTGLPFEIWLSEIPFQIKKAQLMQIRVNTQLPSEEEIQDWYNKNKQKVGFEIKVREIIKVPKDSSLQEEQRVFEEISAISKEIKKDKSAFASIAASSRNQSKSRGGLIDWLPAFELYNQSKMVTSMAMSLGEGVISDVFRDEKKRYCIVRLEGKRPTPLEVIRRGIQNVLYKEKEESAFDNWIQHRKKEIPITIFDKEYLQENKMKPPVEDIIPQEEENETKSK